MQYFKLLFFVIIPQVVNLIIMIFKILTKLTIIVDIQQNHYILLSTDRKWIMKQKEYCIFMKIINYTGWVKTTFLSDKKY